MLYIVLGIAALVVASVQTAAYYYFQKSSHVSESASSLVAVNALINYGNGTVHWYNQTVPSNWNFYELTLNLTRGNLQAESYPPPLNEHLVLAINGVTNNGTFSWWLWRFCQVTNAWSSSNVGADLIRVSNAQTIAWAYAKSTQQPPVPGAKTTGSC